MGGGGCNSQGPRGARMPDGGAGGCTSQEGARPSLDEEDLLMK